MRGRNWWTPTGSVVTPDLLCPITVASAKFIFVLFTHLYSTLTSACSSPALVPRVAMILSPFTPLPEPDAAQGVQDHALCFPFGLLETTLLLSSLSLAITCCFWVMDHRLNNFCAAEECISLFSGEEEFA